MAQLKLGTLISGNLAWHAGNDGTGSGLDADLLDGLHAASTNTVSTVVARDEFGNFAANSVILAGNIAVDSGNITTLSDILTIGNTATTAQTINIGAAATANLTAKIINIGTAGVSGSTTNVNIGSAVVGALGSVTIAPSTTASSTTTGALIVTGGVGIGGNLYVGNPASFSSDVTITGTLTVNGTTTTINSSTLTVDDKNIELGSVTAIAGLVGTITTVALVSTVTGLTSTVGLIPGMTLVKVSGIGAFGTNAIITSIDSLTQITVTGTTDHTVGAITFNVGGATDVTANGGGITIKGTTDKTFTYDNANSRFTTNIGLNVAGALTVTPANANVTLSPTGTGTVTLNPATAGTINNMSIGATARAAGSFTTLASNGLTTMTSNTTSTSTTTGTLVVTGGVGISENVYIGGNISVLGIITGNAATASKWYTPRTITFAGGDVTGAFTLDGSADVSNIALTIEANSIALGTDTTGNYVATLSDGTPGVQTGTSGLTIVAATGENTAATISHADTSTLSGAQGTAGIASITVDGMGHITAVTTATYLTAEVDTLQTVTTRGNTTDTAVLITNTTESTSVDTGALQVDGGVGINKNLYVGGNLNAAGFYLNGLLFSGGGSGKYIRKTANYTAAINEQIIADATGGTFTITLPATPAIGDSISIVDGADWETTNVTVARNGSTIEDSPTDLTLNVGKLKVDLVYDGTTWQVYSTGTPPLPVINDISTDTTQYLGMTRSTSVWDSAYISTSKLYFNPSTGVLTSTDYNSLSDITLKENISPIVDSIALLKQINPVSFNWKDTGRKSYGVIAQELEKILPELVSTSNDTALKSVAYTQLIAFLIDAINQQQIELNTIKQHLGI